MVVRIDNRTLRVNNVFAQQGTPRGIIFEDVGRSRRAIRIKAYTQRQFTWHQDPLYIF
jgi:hypothetical protein